MRHPVPGFPGYSADTEGTIYGLGGSPLKPWISAGYQTVGLRRDGVTHRIHVHRLVLATFAGSGDGLDGCHTNGDRLDNRLSNLRWATRSENILDQVRHGRHNNARKTHCLRGHEFTPENIYERPNGRRQCVTCTKAASMTAYQKRRSAA